MARLWRPQNFILADRIIPYTSIIGKQYRTMSSYEREGEERDKPRSVVEESDNRVYVAEDYAGYDSTQNRPYPQAGGARTYVMVMDENEYYDPREQNENPGLMKFQDKSRRALFVRKVLGLVALQFLACTLVISVCQFEPKTKHFLSNATVTPGGRLYWGEIITYSCIIPWFVLFCAIGCCRVGYGKPNCFNISLFIVSTLLLSVYSGAATARYDLPAILIAAATTVGVVLILSLITFNSKFDITSKYIYILGAVVAVVLFSIICSLLFSFNVIKDQSAGTIVSLVLSLLFSILFAVFILYELKKIVGGGRQEYGEDDWLLASISLFYNILMFFMQMLRLTRFAN